MSFFSSNQKIGDIVAQFPAAGEVLKEYKIDFCCGGDRPLAKAIEEQGLNEKEILDKINGLYEKFRGRLHSKDKSWVDAPIVELVDHILNRHHGYLYENLPAISRLTALILKVHGGNHPELSKVYRLFHTIKMELEEHLIKEETIQYPAIREYAKSGSEADLKRAVAVIAELEKEHAGAGDILKELRKVTEDYAIPSDVCETFERTYQMLREFESDLFEHIHLENNILFKRLFELQKNRA